MRTMVSETSAICQSILVEDKHSEFNLFYKYIGTKRITIYLSDFHCRRYIFYKIKFVSDMRKLLLILNNKRNGWTNLKIPSELI